MFSLTCSPTLDSKLLIKYCISEFAVLIKVMSVFRAFTACASPSTAASFDITVSNWRVSGTFDSSSRTYSMSLRLIQSYKISEMIVMYYNLSLLSSYLLGHNKSFAAIVMMKSFLLHMLVAFLHIEFCCLSNILHKDTCTLLHWSFTMFVWGRQMENTITNTHTHTHSHTHMHTHTHAQNMHTHTHAHTHTHTHSMHAHKHTYNSTLYQPHTLY